VQARHFGSKRLILFEDVDVYLPIEHDMAGQKQVMPYVIRARNRKPRREIHHGIRTAQVQDVTKDLTRVQSLPTLLFQPYLWLLTWIGRTHPRLWKKNVGTVGITAVGMFENGAGWGIPITPPTPLMMTVGGIGEKPGVVDGHIAIRDYLRLTISLDNDRIDGARW